jgi:hypothetical protein
MAERNPENRPVNTAGSFAIKSVAVAAGTSSSYRKAGRLNAVRQSPVWSDIGPSTIAAGGQTDAIFAQFCPCVVQPWKELRRIERAMDRSKWANNAACFDDKGRWKKGARMRVRSKRYQALTLRSVSVVSPLSVSAATARLPIAFSVRAPRSKPKSCPIKRGNGSATARALRFAPPACSCGCLSETPRPAAS